MHQYPTIYMQILALLIITGLGILLIRAFRRKEIPQFIDVPVTKCQKDYSSIMGCIEDATTIEQLQKLVSCSHTFFKLHYVIDGDNREVIRLYMELQTSIDNKKAEINAVTEVY